MNTDQELEKIVERATSMSCNKFGCQNCVRSAVKDAYELGQKNPK